MKSEKKNQLIHIYKIYKMNPPPPQCNDNRVIYPILLN